MRSEFRRVFAWLAVLCCASQGVWAQHLPPDTPGTGTIKGTVLDGDEKKLQGVQVLAYHLSLSKLFKSERTRGDGQYLIAELPFGYYDVAVETSDGLYVADRALNLAPATTASVTLTVAPFEPTTAGQARRFPGSDLECVGLAEMRAQAKGREFWRSPKGVAIMAGLGGAALLAIAAGSDSEGASTQF